MPKFFLAKSILLKDYENKNKKLIGVQTNHGVEYFGGPAAPTHWFLYNQRYFDGAILAEWKNCQNGTFAPVQEIQIFLLLCVQFLPKSGDKITPHMLIMWEPLIMRVSVSGRSWTSKVFNTVISLDTYQFFNEVSCWSVISNFTLPESNTGLGFLLDTPTVKAHYFGNLVCRLTSVRF